MPVLEFRRNLSLILKSNDGSELALDASDHNALLGCLRHRVVIEEGITVAHLILALEPWSEMLSRAGWLDMAAWVTGVRRSGPTRPPKGDPPGKAVEVGPCLRLRRQGDGILAETRWRIRGLWDTAHGDWTEGHGEDFALLPLDLSAWVNLPLRIENRAKPTGSRADKRVARLHDAMAEAAIEFPPTFHDAVILGILDEISGYGSPEAA